MAKEADVTFTKGDDSVWVRVKPHNAKRGFKAKTYSVFGYRFQEGRGWYKINRVMLWGDGKDRKPWNVGDYLSKIRTNPEDEQSQLVFDVCTEKEANAINLAEKKRAEKAAEPSNPIVDLTEGGGDLTTRDVRAGTRQTDEDEDGDLAPAPAAVVKRERGRPPGSKNKPKVEAVEG